jgi:hypothetical protein
MRPIGFSTGALAYGDFRQGLRMLEHKPVQALELSALRQGELIPLLRAIPSLDLASFQYVSIHAPSQFDSHREAALSEQLAREVTRGWPIVLHPDAIRDFGMWRELGSAICIENMDKRKPIGRSARELSVVLGELPDAMSCFDIGHARQFDPTMTEAWLILREFGSKLRQVHVSEVNTCSKHESISYTSIMAFREVAHLIPVSVPLILEMPVTEVNIEAEIARVREALPVKPETLVA